MRTTFEVVAAYVHRAGFSAVVVVVYRPGCCNATQGFFDDFGDLLERLATYSAPLLIVGDFNIHVDDTTDTGAGRLHEILTTYIRSIAAHSVIDASAWSHTRPADYSR